MDNVHVNHRQRMRKKFKAHGLDVFHDHEILEMLLYYCYPRCDTNPIAHKMLREFSTLHNLFDASVDALMSRLGCTENVAVMINLMGSTAKRYLQSKWDDKIPMDSPEVVGEYAVNLFAGDTVEAFYIICLDTQLRHQHTALIAKGTINAVSIMPRELIRVVLEHQAANVILAHNHPSGGDNISPSHSDHLLTNTIKNSLAIIEVPLIDHVIACGGKYYSYAQHRKRHVDGY